MIDNADLERLANGVEEELSENNRVLASKIGELATGSLAEIDRVVLGRLLGDLLAIHQSVPKNFTELERGLIRLGCLTRVDWAEATDYRSETYPDPAPAHDNARSRGAGIRIGGEPGGETESSGTIFEADLPRGVTRSGERGQGGRELGRAGGSRSAVETTHSAGKQVAVVPDAQAEARLVAHTVFGWLDDPGIVVDDVTILIPDNMPYLPLLLAELDRFGVPYWSPTTTATLNRTRAGQVTTALARSLDGQQPCLQCTNDSPGHDCTGAFASVSEVVAALADPDLSELILDAARSLTLTGGIGNWTVLID